MPRSQKTQTIVVRVSSEMKTQILTVAAARDEGEAVIIREALAAYLAARGLPSAIYPLPSSSSLSHAAESALDSTLKKEDDRRAHSTRRRKSS